MDCATKTLVQYQPGLRWSELDKNIDEHLAFLSAPMRAGRIQFAGPTTDKAGQKDGGFSVYNSADKAAVEALIKGDALVRQHIVTYVIRSWMQCSAALSTPAAPKP